MHVTALRKLASIFKTEKLIKWIQSTQTVKGKMYQFAQANKLLHTTTRLIAFCRLKTFTFLCRAFHLSTLLSGFIDSSVISWGKLISLRLFTRRFFKQEQKVSKVQGTLLVIFIFQPSFQDHSWLSWFVNATRQRFVQWKLRANYELKWLPKLKVKNCIVFTTFVVSGSLLFTTKFFYFICLFHFHVCMRCSSQVAFVQHVEEVAVSLANWVTRLAYEQSATFLYFPQTSGWSQTNYI